MTQSLTEARTIKETPLSVTGKIWQIMDPDPRTVQAIMQQFGVPEIIACILVNRGLSVDQVESFMSPSLKQLMPDPSSLLDMDKAVSLVYEHILAGKKIAVFGDYDVDGATSSAIIKRYFGLIGVECEVYIPDRIDEGYGPNEPALQSLKDRGIELVIMVDCGTTSFEPIAFARSIGLTVIVLDHHVAQPRLPEANALVNPNRLDENCTETLGNICAAGLSFLFIVALNRYLRESALHFKEERDPEDSPKPQEPDLRQLLDLVALGTVCDVMTLTGLNRAYVRLGLAVIAQRMNTGIRSLADRARVSQVMSTYHLGFVLGPRINAGGRVGEASLGARLLSSDDPQEARQMAERLDIFNTERQQIEKEVLNQALAQVEDKKLYERSLIMVESEGWHPGVIGIVAGRIKERYGRPSCVVSFHADKGKGSGRSVMGIDMGRAMHQALHYDYLAQGGGHAMAAGFTVLRPQYDKLYDFLCERFDEHQDCLTPRIIVDASLHPNGITERLASDLTLLEPYGNGNPAPRFLIHHARVGYVSVFSDAHIRGTIVAENGRPLPFLAFRSVGTALGNALLSERKVFDMLVTIKNDSWNGTQELKITIEDLRG